MTDKELILAEIEGRLQYIRSLKIDSDYYNAQVIAYEELIDFINSLPEEPVSKVWHDSNIEQPENGSTVVIWNDSCGEVLTNCVKVNPDRMWAYMNDLLHKKEEPVTIDFDGIYHEWLKKEWFTGVHPVSEFCRMTAEHFFKLGQHAEEPTSDDLKQAIHNAIFALDERKGYTFKLEDMFMAGARWQKEILWKLADGDNLPEIDREVIALEGIIDPTATDCFCGYKVVFAHRPNPNGWDGKNLDTGEITHYEPKLYDEGGWNVPNIAYWLNIKLPKEIEL